MAHTEYHKFKNIPNPIIEEKKKWIQENPRLARRAPEDTEEFKIEVFGYKHKEVANDLYNALLSSGFLNKYPINSIRIEPMQ